MGLWGRHVLDDVIIADFGADDTVTKAQRQHTQAKARRRAHERGPARALRARTLDFADSVLSLTLQQPYKRQSYFAARIYVNRDGRYQMAVGSHAAIASVPDFALAKQLPSK